MPLRQTSERVTLCLAKQQQTRIKGQKPTFLTHLRNNLVFYLHLSEKAANMPLDHGMEPPTIITSHGMMGAGMMSPGYYTSPDFPSEYDNSAGGFTFSTPSEHCISLCQQYRQSDAFVESANYDEAPYGVYNFDSRRESVDTTNAMYTLDNIPDANGPTDTDATAQPTRPGKQLNESIVSPRRLSIAVPQPSGKMGSLSARRLSFDPLRYPSPTSAGTDRESTFATAAEDFEAADEELVNETPADVHGGTKPDEELGDEIDYGEIEIPQDDDEGVYRRAVVIPGEEEEAGFVPELKEEKQKQMARAKFEEEHGMDPEEDEPAYKEEDEDDYEVGLLRKEHDGEFQDVAGLDLGDEYTHKTDDDEGMDPYENA